MRSSRQDTEKHRQEIIDAAAKLGRERGLDAVSVPGLMAEVGMTHGGFYKHFASKDALAPIALERAFEMIFELMQQSSNANAATPETAMQQFIENYLSPGHRDNAGTGCASSAHAGDMAREEIGSPLQQAYVEGVAGMVDRLASFETGPADEAHQKALFALSTMVGALLLSRATRGSAMSDDVLEAARAGLHR